MAKPWRNASGCPRVLAKRTRFAEVSLTNQYGPLPSRREAPHVAQQSIVRSEQIVPDVRPGCHNGVSQGLTGQPYHCRIRIVT